MSTIMETCLELKVSFCLWYFNSPIKLSLSYLWIVHKDHTASLSLLVVQDTYPTSLHVTITSSAEKINDWNLFCFIINSTIFGQQNSCTIGLLLYLFRNLLKLKQWLDSEQRHGIMLGWRLSPAKEKQILTEITGDYDYAFTSQMPDIQPCKSG